MLLVEYPEASDEEANRAAITLARDLADSAPAGFRDAIPAARTLLVLFDADAISRDRLAAELSKRSASAVAVGEPARSIRFSTSRTAVKYSASFR